MKLDSSTSLQSIIRTFMGGGTTNIFNQFGDTQNNQLNQNQGYINRGSQKDYPRISKSKGQATGSQIISRSL